MERDDIEGAKAAAEYFLELYPYVFATGDLDDWEAMSHPECEFCSGAADRVSELFDEGGYGAGGEIAIVDIDAREPDTEWPHFRVGIKATEAAAVEYSPQGEMVDTFGGGDVQYNFALVQRDGRWIVLGVALEGIE